MCKLHYLIIERSYFQQAQFVFLLLVTQNVSLMSLHETTEVMLRSLEAERNVCRGQIKSHTNITAQRQDTPAQGLVNTTSAEIQTMNRKAHGVTLQILRVDGNTVILVSKVHRVRMITV